MKNVLTFNTGGFLSLENISGGSDVITIRYYVHGLTAPKIKVDGTLYNLTISGNYGEYTLNTSGVTKLNPIIYFNLNDNGTDYASFSLAFWDFNDTGNFICNIWQKQLQVFKTGNASVFHAYIIALVETQTTTIGAGLTVDEHGQITVNTGTTLKKTSDGKVETVEGTRHVDSIEVTEDSNDRISSITINYDDETVHSYACSYDSSGNLTSFGGVPISWGDDSE